jgi:MerR family transcriptional regulator/heat shock protein HspR
MAKRSDQRRQDDLGVYIISVAAELAGVHPQTLRIYERRGLLRPSRTAGNTRRYSERDIARLRTIQHLTQEEGINLAGVKMIVQLENELDRTRRQLEATARELERTRRRLGEELERRQRESRRGSLVLLRELQRLPWEVTP